MTNRKGTRETFRKPKKLFKQPKDNYGGTLSRLQSVSRSGNFSAQTYCCDKKEGFYGYDCDASPTPFCYGNKKEKIRVFNPMPLKHRQVIPIPFNDSERVGIITRIVKTMPSDRFLNIPDSFGKTPLDYVEKNIVDFSDLLETQVEHLKLFESSFDNDNFTTRFYKYYNEKPALKQPVIPKEKDVIFSMPYVLRYKHAYETSLREALKTVITEDATLTLEQRERIEKLIDSESIFVFSSDVQIANDKTLEELIREGTVEAHEKAKKNAPELLDKIKIILGFTDDKSRKPREPLNPKINPKRFVIYDRLVKNKAVHSVQDEVPVAYPIAETVSTEDQDLNRSYTISNGVRIIGKAIYSSKTEKMTANLNKLKEQLPKMGIAGDGSDLHRIFRMINFFFNSRLDDEKSITALYDLVKFLLNEDRNKVMSMLKEIDAQGKTPMHILCDSLGNGQINEYLGNGLGNKVANFMKGSRQPYATSSGGTTKSIPRNGGKHKNSTKKNNLIKGGNDENCLAILVGIGLVVACILFFIVCLIGIAFIIVCTICIVILINIFAGIYYYGKKAYKFFNNLIYSNIPTNIENNGSEFDNRIEETTGFNFTKNVTRQVRSVTTPVGRFVTKGTDMIGLTSPKVVEEVEEVSVPDATTAPVPDATTAPVSDATTAPVPHVAPSPEIKRDPNYKPEQATITEKIILNEKDENGKTALIRACEDGDIELAKNLLNEGASPDVQNAEGYTALMIACRENNIELVKLLLEKYANVDVIAKDGTTTAFTIAKKTNPALAKLLDPLNKKGVLPNFLVDAIPFQLPFFGGKRRTKKHHIKTRKQKRKTRKP